MKKFLLLFLFIICVSGILLGKMHWENKIETMSIKANAKETQKSTVADEKAGNSLDGAMSNFSKELKELVQKKVSDNKSITIAAVGSDATSDGDDSWPSILQSELDESYGKEVFSINVRSLGDKNSLEAMRIIREEGVETTPDVLLLEPFLLKDNGEIRIEDSLDAITSIISTYKNVNEDMIIILQPSNPLYDSKYYPLQVDQLKKYAKDNDYLYLNHWNEWPNQDSEKMAEYLTEESEPNKKGHQVWADYLVGYFTGQ
ncbi:SGNH/GDSL hydrolase family protein [Pseudalkalibacillus hwajinpoensis]|uniref:SGNH/GDSL hydrolase family protein n=1 Tax=Guptibacillus hwajinpoensis TaxID=208199 RepID=UPI001CD22A8A|nr:SGNH/GDSL hydrolase family protein [Pseudalkalibacillus hwajinpoensis]MCA0991596.1 SGNH/GDSL hydrolase family protein [Pseudalkalibacillus hwajinpoensis]